MMVRYASGRFSHATRHKMPTTRLEHSCAVINDSRRRQGENTARITSVETARVGDTRHGRDVSTPLDMTGNARPLFMNTPG